MSGNDWPSCLPSTTSYMGGGGTCSYLNAYDNLRDMSFPLFFPGLCHCFGCLFWCAGQMASDRLPLMALPEAPKILNCNWTVVKMLIKHLMSDEDSDDSVDSHNKSAKIYRSWLVVWQWLDYRDPNFRVELFHMTHRHRVPRVPWSAKPAVQFFYGIMHAILVFFLHDFLVIFLTQWYIFLHLGLEAKWNLP